METMSEAQYAALVRQLVSAPDGSSIMLTVEDLRAILAWIQEAAESLSECDRVHAQDLCITPSNEALIKAVSP